MSSVVEPPKISRRNLIKIGAGGALLYCFRLPMAQAEAGVLAPNAFIRIVSDSRVTLIMPQVEMGQGVYTSIAMILAEELDADFATVTLEHAPPSDKLYGNPAFGIQVTGHSNSIRAFWKPLREAGATARAMLVQAAARQWKVYPASCRTSSGQVFHDASGRKLSYGVLASHAANIVPPANAPVKDPKDFTLIGKPIKRLDTPGKVNGQVRYGIDAMPPGVKFATIAASPVFGGTVGHLDDTKAKTVGGVRQVIALDDMVAVVGDTMWAAKQGLAALDITWNDGLNAEVDSQKVWEDLRRASTRAGVVAKTVGDADKALAGSDKIEAVYELPFLAHAAMEPLNCTAHVTPGACELWLGTQVITRVQGTVAHLLGIQPEKVTIHQHLIGGSFGRRLEPDLALKAVRVAQRVDGPVKVVWTREEDMQHDYYRPVYRDIFAASVKDDRIDGWTHRITGASLIARWLPSAFQREIDVDAVEDAVDIPYSIPNVRIEYVRCEPPAVPTGFWRGVGHNNNVFTIESFVDEVAHKIGQDPVVFRLAMLDKTPRLKAAVALAAQKSGWGSRLPARTGRGIAAQVALGSFIAAVCEVEADSNGEVKIHRVVVAVDTGITVNPDTIVALLEGGIIFGLTAARFGEITISKGRVKQSNFHDYRVLRINEVPQIEVHLIKSAEAPGGIGEAGTSVAPPALGNALFAATGVRLRRLPIDRDVLLGKKPG